MELWTLTIADPLATPRHAARAEADGWDGVVVVDSQNLSPDSYVALATAAQATSRIGLGTGVTNPVTRHPAVTASAIAAIQRLSGGRAVLGIGRGDSALAHLGRAPASVRTFERYVDVLQRYLHREPVPFEDLAFQAQGAPPVGELDLKDTPADSRIVWMDADTPKVPVEVAATGPRVIGVAAERADLVMLTLGAVPERIEWGMEHARRAVEAADRAPAELGFGAYVNMACHPDADTARALVRGSLTPFARFSVMHGAVPGPAAEAEQRVLQALHDGYDMRAHTRADSSQAALMTPAFIDRYAIAGPPEHCVERLRELAGLGLDKVIVSGPTAGSDPDAARRSRELIASDVLPALRG